MEFTADQVWAIAVRVDRENGGYVKLPVYHETLDVVKTQPNKVIVKEMIRNNYQPTEEEVEAGREVRRYFNTFTMKLLAGKINEFEQTALKIAQKDSFTGRDMYDFAVVSCLPDVARRDVARTELKREIYASEQLIGNVGDRVQGLITVISCRFNPNYNKFKVQARMGEAFVDFWYSQELEGELTIKGKIKAVRGDKTTALNFVKKA
jgi:hypothetical protein